MIILRGGRVLDPSQGLDETADVVIEAGRIKDVGRDAGAVAGLSTARETPLCGSTSKVARK